MYCAGESIDGTWYGCGCTDCQQAEYDAIEADAETGALTQAEALDLHHFNNDL